MIGYKAVPSGLELSCRIKDCLEDAAPREYQFGEGICAIRAINDILQGRSTRSVDELLAELEKCGDHIVPLLQSVRSFLRQKELLMTPYVKRTSRKPFTFQSCSVSEGRKLKVIDQMLYVVYWELMELVWNVCEKGGNTFDTIRHDATRICFLLIYSVGSYMIQMFSFGVRGVIYAGSHLYCL